MPRPKPTAKASGRQPQKTQLALKGVDDWGDWLRRFAEHASIPIASLVDVSLKREAKRQGFAEPMPRRQAGK